LPNEPNLKRQYSQLLRQQLLPGETLDGIFSCGSDVTVALTSDRLIQIVPSLPNGWSLKAIPWRLLTELTLDPSEDSEDSPAPENTIRLQYAVPDKARYKTAPRSVEPDQGVESEPKARPQTDLVLNLTPQNQKLAALIRGHLALAVSASG